jgi:Zn-dependent protease with chaperone function
MAQKGLLKMAVIPEVDLDFRKYVTLRRGAAELRARDGAAYSYSGEMRVRRTLSMARPVTLAIEATVRLWQSVARNDLLGSAVKVTDQQFPRLYAIAARCAAILHIPVPAVYVSPAIGELNAHTLGTDEDAYIVVNGALIDHLTDEELTFVLGHECGHIHNSHVVFSTALHYLTEAAAFYVRWIVQPAILALRAWSRRAEITCDRAGLLCVKDIDVANSSMVKLALGSQKLYKDLKIDEYLKQLPEGRKGIGRFAELLRSHPYVPKRIEALRVFAGTELYRRHAGLGEGGTPTDDCDEAVAKILSVF